MTTESISDTSGRTRVLACGVVGLLAVVTTACAESSGGNTAGADGVDVADVVEFADESSGSDDRGGGSTFDDLEYGDSVDELDHLGRTEAAPANVAIPGFEPVEWDDLIPPGFTSEEVLARYEDRITSAPAGSPELDALYEEMNAEFETGSINSEFDGDKVQLAGFVAPLTYDGDEITEFLLVPYFGACIHVPPPPANQTVMVSLADGESLSLEESWGAVWVAGEMTATTNVTDLATAGYAISGPVFGVYDGQ